jgi:hypothetical protein
MAQTFANLLTHIVFSTQDRVSNIRPELRPDFAPSKLLSSHSIQAWRFTTAGIYPQIPLTGRHSLSGRGREKTFNLPSGCWFPQNFVADSRHFERH